MNDHHESDAEILHLVSSLKASEIAAAARAADEWNFYLDLASDATPGGAQSRNRRHRFRAAKVPDDAKYTGIVDYLLTYRREVRNDVPDVWTIPVWFITDDEVWWLNLGPYQAEYDGADAVARAQREQSEQSVAERRQAKRRERFDTVKAEYLALAAEFEPETVGT